MSLQASTAQRQERVLPRRRPGLSARARLVIGMLGMALLAGGVVAVMEFMQDPLRFPVSNVDILGTVDYADRKRLQDDLVSFLEDGFYGLDIDDIRRSVEQSPWVASASVRRIWPSRIEVRVEEHEPGARWNDNQLISKQQQLFSPPQLQNESPEHQRWRAVFADLPVIHGVPGRHQSLLEAYRQYQHELAAFDLTLAELNEDERGSRTLILSNRVTVRLGYEEQELRMQRFVDVYERMASSIERQTDISGATFDMRYSNGFALGGVTTDNSASVRTESTRPLARALQNTEHQDG